MGLGPTCLRQELSFDREQLEGPGESVGVEVVLNRDLVRELAAVHPD
jgi:hypothetical protein